MRPPAFFHHVGHHLMVTLNMELRLFLDHRIPVLARHLDDMRSRVLPALFTIFCTSMLAMLSLGLVKASTVESQSRHCHRGVEGEPQRLLFPQPFGMVYAWTRACNDLETFFVQALEMAVPMPPMPPVTYATF